MEPGGDNDPSPVLTDTDDSDYSSAESMYSDADEDGDNISLPNVVEAFYHERAEDHCGIYPETESIVSDTGNNTGSSSSATVPSRQDHQPPVPNPNTCKTATRLKGVRATKVKSGPAGIPQSKPARKAETKRPRIFECRSAGCTKTYTTQYSLTSQRTRNMATLATGVCFVTSSLIDMATALDTRTPSIG